MVLSPKERIDRVCENWTDISWWKNTGFPGLYQEIIRPLRAPTHLWYSLRNQRENLVTADWDTLIILDCCRPDVLRSAVGPQERSAIDARLSLGSATIEWLRRSFTEERYPEIVYTTANPQLARVNPGAFADVNHVWQSAWNQEKNTVLPEDVVSVAREAHHQHPQKRHIVHFLQPHAPFLGPTAERQSLPRGAFGGGAASELDPASESIRDVYESAQYGEVSKEMFGKSYTETLERVVEPIRDLATDLDGKVVVSADHGELLGERTLVEPWLRYGHKAGRPTLPLIRVPWWEINNDTRRDIKPAKDLTSASKGSNKDEVAERLEALGYH